MNVQLPEIVANLAKPTRYISVVETAKLIRQALKEAYPEIKFSVVSSKYSGGASIDVRYQGDALQKDVEAIAKAFQGGSFDGMTDCKGYLRKTMNGEPVSFGGDFVFVSRDFDKDKIAAMGAIIAQVGASEDKVERDNLVANFLIKFGMVPNEAFRAVQYNMSGGCLARALLGSLSDPKFAGRTSKLADSVVFLSNSNDRAD